MGILSDEQPRRRQTDHEPTPGWGPVIALIAGVAALDWITKAFVATTVPVGGMVEVWADRLALIHVRNAEMMLGLWGWLPLEGRMLIAGGAGLLLPLLVYALVVRGHRLPRRHRWSVWIFVGLAAGGMLGNLGERALHWKVTDFLSIGWNGLWLPPGNIADLAIIAAIPFIVPAIVFELLARSRRGRLRPPRMEPSPATGRGAAPS